MNINLKDLVVRIIFSMLAIFIVSFITPGIRFRGSFVTLLIIGLAVGFLHALITDVLNISDSASKRGSTAFLVSAVVLYITGKLVDGFSVSIIGALIGSLVLGIVQGILPQSKLRG